MQSTLSALSKKGYSYINDVAKYGKRDQFLQQYNVSLNKASEKNSFNASVTYKNDRLEDKYTKDNSFGISFTDLTHLYSWLDLEIGSYTNYGNATTQSYNSAFYARLFVGYVRRTCKLRRIELRLREGSL